MSTRDLQAIGASDERSSTRARCYLQLNLETDLIRLRRLLPQRQSRPCRDRSISSIRRACGKGARSLLCGWLQAHCGGRREPLQPHCGGRGQNPCGRTAEAGEKPLQSHCGCRGWAPAAQGRGACRAAAGWPGGSCRAGEGRLPGRRARTAGAEAPQLPGRPLGGPTPLGGSTLPNLGLQKNSPHTGAERSL